MHDARPDLVGADLVERGDDRLDRALHVALDEERELLDAGRLQLGHHLLELAARAGVGHALAPLALAIIGDLAGARLVLDHGELIAGLGRAVEAEHLDRHRRARARTCSPFSLIIARTRP